MRTRDLVVIAPSAKAWFTLVTINIFWLVAVRVLGDPETVVSALESWLAAHKVESVGGVDGMQLTVLMVLIPCALAAYAAGQLLVRPVFTRRWAVPLFFIGLAMLDVQAAAWIGFGSIIVLGVGYISVSKGRINSLIGVPFWMRLVYAGAFTLMAWLMCAFTAEAKNYPGYVAAFVMSQAPQQWSLGFWLPDVTLAALFVLAALVSYVVGGYFFNYLTRHWIGPVSLVIVLAVLTPADRFKELLLIGWGSGVLVVLAQVLVWSFIGLFIYAVIGSLKGSRTSYVPPRRTGPYPYGITDTPSMHSDMDAPFL